MSEVVTPSVSISELATTLRSAITADQQLLLSKSTVNDLAWSKYLFGLLEVETLVLAAAQVSDAEGGFCVTGRASFLTLTDLSVALTVTALDGGLGLSLRATPAGGPSALAGRVAGLDLPSLLPAGAGRPVDGAASSTLRSGKVRTSLSRWPLRSPGTSCPTRCRLKAPRSLSACVWQPPAALLASLFGPRPCCG